MVTAVKWPCKGRYLDMLYPPEYPWQKWSGAATLAALRWVRGGSHDRDRWYGVRYRISVRPADCPGRHPSAKIGKNTLMSFNAADIWTPSGITWCARLSFADKTIEEHTIPILKKLSRARSLIAGLPPSASRRYPTSDRSGDRPYTRRGQ
jgi:hypothetical protein